MFDVLRTNRHIQTVTRVKGRFYFLIWLLKVSHSSLHPHQHPLLWDECSDGCGRGAGGDHAAGAGDEEDGAEQPRRPQLGAQRQPRGQPWGGGGPCEEEVCLLMSPPAHTLLTFNPNNKTLLERIRKSKIWSRKSGRIWLLKCDYL